MNYKTLFLIGLSFVSFSFIANTEDDVVVKNELSTKLIASNTTVSKKMISQLFFESLDENNFSLPRLESFTKAFEGYTQLKEQGLIVKDFLTIVDFGLSSNVERLWVVDMLNRKVVYLFICLGCIIYYYSCNIQHLVCITKLSMLLNY